MDDAGAAAVGRQVVAQPFDDRVAIDGVPGDGVFPALDPALDLAPRITSGTAEVFETRLGQIHRMQIAEHVEEIEQLPARPIRAQVQSRRVFAADYQAADIVHQVEIAADDVVVVTEVQRNRAVGKHVFQRRENAELPRHVVGRFHLAAEWRPAQHPLLATAFQQISEIGMAARELFYFKFVGGRAEHGAQIIPQPLQRQFFSGPYAARLVFEIGSGHGGFQRQGLNDR